MNTNIILGMDIPQLDLSNFKIADSSKIDINRYFQQLGDITVEIKDEEIRNDIFHRYIVLRRERIAEFDEAYNEFFSRALDNTFNCEVKKAFLVGEFYTSEEVKNKLKALYSHEFAPLEFYCKTPKMTNLRNNGWFNYKYIQRKISGRSFNGILITDCLF